MRWPLRVQILVPYAALMMAVLVAVSFLNALFASQLSQRQIEKQLQGVARTLIDSSFPLNEAVLKQVTGLSGAEFILMDRDGHVITVGSALAKRLAADLPHGEPSSNLELNTPVEVGGQHYFQIALDMSQRASRVEPRMLHILYPEAGLTEAKQQAAYPSLVVGVVALITASALGLLAADRVSWPLRSVCRHVEKLTQAGDERLPVPKRNDELRDLVVSVNCLAEQLDDMRLAIRRSERLSLLGQLSGGIAHHLRNNIAGAKVAVQLHQRHCRDCDPESLEVALRQLALTEEHLMGLLAAGKPQQLRPASCNLGALVQEVVTLIGPTCQHHKITLQTTVDISPVAFIDGDQIRSVILGLVLNAIDAAGSGGWVQMELAAGEDQMAVLAVMDSGAGLSPKIVDRLFEPFATTKREGIGLGLAAALQIAKLHGGKLRHVEASRPTRFELHLPLHHATIKPVDLPETVETS